MGMTTEEIDRRRKLPWPRYRLSIWSPINHTWHEHAKLYFSTPAILDVARRRALALESTKLRVCIMQESGKKEDISLKDFETTHGKTEK